MRKLFRQYLIPISLGAALIFALCCWLAFELFNVYGQKKLVLQNVLDNFHYIVVKQLQTCAAGDRNIDSILKELTDNTELEFIKVEHNSQLVYQSNTKHPLFNYKLSREKSGYLSKDKTAFSWKTVHLPALEPSQNLKQQNFKPYRITIALKTTNLLIPAKVDVNLFLFILLLGFAVVTIFLLTWSLSARNRNLNLRLRTAKMREDQVDELSLAAAGLAHETKNPLGIIRGLAQRITEVPNLDEKTCQMAQTIMEEADITTARLGDFMSYANLRNPDLAPVNAVDHISRIALLVNEDFKSSNVELKTNIIEASFLADAEMLSQILLNLLMNSLKSTQSGDTVTLQLEKAGNAMAQLKVIDTGQGIAPEILPKIFKPYFTKRVDGYGIGLAIVKRIVEKSGWEITIDSEVGVGTEVKITGIKLVSS